ncbi:hypothetical protein GGP80_001181 [Salinibacter ruber]|uniref:hypothetical protein n=1 Tax=Salinibacter ruber TaxID=146919 RepID=UPI0021680273|nr:hypothetical protein [Salinibacter ruber]MCS3935207.1 hypothetical protein [Salinibacter ruber]MCS4043242.1 hypothetical protein [Salinibacter ruber]
MLTKGKVNLTRWIVGLPLLITVFVPRSAGFDNPFFIFGTIGGVIGFAFLVQCVQRAGLSRTLFVVWVWLGLIAFITTCSQLLNTSGLYTSGLTRILRPLFYMVVVAYGYKIGVQKKGEDIESGLLWAAYVIIIAQVVVGFTQSVGIDVFGLLYGSEKASPLYKLLRITGTMGNPNLFGWIILQVFIIIVLLNKKEYPYIPVVLCFALIVSSGSRTMVLIFPFALIFTQTLRQSVRVRVGQLLMLSVLVLAGVVGLLWTFAEYIPYIAQVEKIFLEGSLSAISSLEMRFIKWANVAERFSQGNWATWLFGLSDRPFTQVLDNSYLFVLFRTGVVGLSVHLSLIVYILGYCYNRRHNDVAKICIAYVSFALVTGLVSESLAGWFFPIWLMYYLGIVIGTENTNHEWGHMAKRIFRTAS